jgi:hypothetical protein
MCEPCRQMKMHKLNCFDDAAPRFPRLSAPRHVPGRSRSLHRRWRDQVRRDGRRPKDAAAQAGRWSGDMGSVQTGSCFHRFAREQSDQSARLHIERSQITTHSACGGSARRNQRAVPVVVRDGPWANGGSASVDPVDPSVPLGPGLGGIWAVFDGPNVRTATAARTNDTAITTNLRRLPSQSCMRLSVAKNLLFAKFG